MDFEMNMQDYKEAFVKAGYDVRGTKNFIAIQNAFGNNLYVNSCNVSYWKPATFVKIVMDAYVDGIETGDDVSINKINEVNHRMSGLKITFNTNAEEPIYWFEKTVPVSVFGILDKEQGGALLIESVKDLLAAASESVAHLNGTYVDDSAVPAYSNDLDF